MIVIIVIIIIYCFQKAALTQFARCSAEITHCSCSTLRFRFELVRYSGTIIAQFFFFLRRNSPLKQSDTNIKTVLVLMLLFVQEINFASKK